MSMSEYYNNIIELHPTQLMTAQDEVDHLRLVSANVDQAKRYYKQVLKLIARDLTPSDFPDGSSGNAA